MVSDPITQSIGTHLDVSGALQRIGDEQAMRDMLSMMKDLLAEEMPNITANLQAGNLVQTARTLHSLRGCVPIFCTPAIGVLMTQSEERANSGDHDGTEVDYRELEPALNQLSDEIGLYLSRPTKSSP